MDSRALQSAAENVARLSLQPPPLSLFSISDLKFDTFNKRNAVYIKTPCTPTPSLASDISTWEYRAPPLSRSSSSSESSTESNGSTGTSAYSSVAQEIAFRYRAGMPIDIEDIERKSYVGYLGKLDARVNKIPWETTYTSPADESEDVVEPDREVKARYRQSRFDALADLRKEALRVMRQAKVGPNDPLVCNRPGCHDTVDGVKALTFHLHIHDIHDRSYTCAKCPGQYETRRELAMHICQVLPASKTGNALKSPPISPIREGFRRAIKISFRG